MGKKSARKPGIKGKSSASPKRLQQVLAQAAQQHQAGELRQAEAGYRQVLQWEPANSDAAYLLGVLYYQEGRFENAVRAFEYAIKGNSSDVVYHLNLGSALQELGRLDEAEMVYQHAARLGPDTPELHNNLGTIYLLREELDKAEDEYREAIRLQPDFALARCNLSGVLLSLEKVDEAAQMLQPVLASGLFQEEASMGMAKISERREQPQLAVTYYQRALEYNPRSSRACGSLANLYKKSGTAIKAIPLYQKALELEPESIDYRIGLSEALIDQGKIDEAVALMEDALDMAPEQAQVLYTYGEIMKKAGRHEEAMRYYRKVLGVNPQAYSVYLDIAQVKKYTPDDPVIDEINGVLDASVLDEQTATDLHFALGKIYSDCREYDQSFEHYAAGNRLRRGQVEFSIEEHRRFTDRLIETFSADFFHHRTWAGNGSELPLFIVGMPRSGTTLTETIISSHPQVYGAGELEDLARIGEHFAQGIEDGRYPECMPYVKEEVLAATSARFIENLRALSPGSRHITDKMPHNFLNVGLIHYLFPKARIIHIRRDPLDNCLSIFFQSFREHRYSYELGELGQYYREYQRLMEHWSTTLGGVMLEVRYEELIDNQEEVTRRVIDFCGLEWDEACLQFHTNRRAVQTASHLQVRQPIYKSSAGRWRRYEKHLAPLREALQG